VPRAGLFYPNQVEFSRIQWTCRIWQNLVDIADIADIVDIADIADIADIIVGIGLYIPLPLAI